MKKSAYNTKGNLRSRRVRRRVWHLVMLFFLLAFLVAGAIGLLWLPALRISSIEISGVQSVPTSMIESSVQEKLSGAYWFVIPRNNVFLYPKKEITQMLQTQFPAFSEVTLQANNFKTLNVLVSERGPRALWCGESVASPSPCLLLDQTGVAYGSAADFSSGIYVRYFGPLAATPARQYMSADSFRALFALVEELAKKSGTVERVALEGVSDVRATFTNGFDLLFVRTDGGADILSRYTVALSAEPFTKHTLSDFQYLDLRFGDKLYYKLK